MVFPRTATNGLLSAGQYTFKGSYDRDGWDCVLNNQGNFIYNTRGNRISEKKEGYFRVRV